MNIIGNKIILRAIEEKDLSLLKEMHNDPDLEMVIIGWAWPLSSFGQEQWLDAVNKSQTNKKFIIQYNNNAVGLVVINDIDWKNRKASTGIKLCKECPKSQGIGTDTMMALERYAFDELQLHRLEASWFETNVPSVKMHKKCGWKEEGVQKDSIFKAGKFHDLTIGRCLESDYREAVKKLNYWK